VDKLPGSQLAPENESSITSDENVDKQCNEHSRIKSYDTMGELQHWYREGGSGNGMPPSGAANTRDQEGLDQKSIVEDQSERKDEVLANIPNDDFNGKEKSDIGQVFC